MRQLCPNTSCDRRCCNSPPPAHPCGSPSQQSTICACRLRLVEVPSPLGPLPYAWDIPRQLNFVWTFYNLLGYSPSCSNHQTESQREHWQHADKETVLY